MNISKVLPSIIRQEKAALNVKANGLANFFRLGRIQFAIMGDKKSFTKAMKEKHGLDFIPRQRLGDARKFFTLVTSKNPEMMELVHSRRFKSALALLKHFDEVTKKNKTAKGEKSQGETSEGESTPELSEALPENMNAKEIAAYVAVICEKYEIKPADVFRELLGQKELVKLTLAA